jgi:hypothetical protein
MFYFIFLIVNIHEIMHSNKIKNGYKNDKIIPTIRKLFIYNNKPNK